VAAELLNTSAIAWGPYPESLAFISFGGPDARIVVTVVDPSTRERTRYGPWQEGEEDLIAWSPDGNELWLVGLDDREGRPSVLDLRDESVRGTSLPGGSQGLAWSADGLALAVTHSGGLTVIRSSGESRTYEAGPAWMPGWLGDEQVVFNSREEISAPDGDTWTLDVARILRLADGRVDTIMPGDQLQPGVYAQGRARATDEPRRPAPRWWD